MGSNMNVSSFLLLERGALLPNYKRRVLTAAMVAVIAGGGWAAVSYIQQNTLRTKLVKKKANTEKKIKSSSAEMIGKNKFKGGMRSLQVLTQILITRAGEKGLQSLLSLIGLAILKTTLSNQLARVQGFLFRATFLRKVPVFVRLIGENLLLCLTQSVIISSVKFLNGSLRLQWRQILTDKIHNEYFKNMVYYKMTNVDRRISSPEQRIASDVPRFCAELSDMVQENIISFCDAAFYTYRLCSYTHPKYAIGILGYVILAGTVTGSLSPPFGKLIAEEQQQEGEYRQLHSRLRTHSESIAFYGGQQQEASIVKAQFRRLTKHVATLFHTQWWFGIIQDFFLKYCGATWAVVLIIGPFFGSDAASMASVEGRAETLSRMRYHTSVVIALFQAMGTLATSTRRVSRLGGLATRVHEMISVSQELKSELASSRGAGSFKEAQCIEFDKVTVVTPTGTTLVENLTLRIEPGHNLLITGPNGSGKSSLFRVLGGLWPLVSGCISKPSMAAHDLSHDIFYVPQRPYSALGTLRDQLVYPLTAGDLREPLSNEEMKRMLQIVDLGSLVERYPSEQEVNWGEELSLGEQQRLGMARLFYHAPKFAILDECTSAVTTDMEERFCERVAAMGTTCVTISHRPALVAFHDTVLALDGEGGWTLHFNHQKRNRKKGNDGLSLDENVFAHTPLSSTPKPGIHEISALSERKSDASVNVRHFLEATPEKLSEKETSLTSHVGPVIQRAPPPSQNPNFLQSHLLKPKPRSVAGRVGVLTKILMPMVLGRQGGQLALLTSLVVARTVLSDRIASLNGATVSNMIHQDLKGFVRLIAVSVLQNSASSFISPTLRYLTVSLALGWRKRLTAHLLERYFQNNAFYKSAHLTESMDDADTRISADVDKLTRDMSSLVTNLIKPLVDILWFTWRMQSLTGRRGVALLYSYMLLGLGFLRAVTPNFGALSSEEQRLEGAFRYMHSRLRTNAESVAFFGGGEREHQLIRRRFSSLLSHHASLLRHRWLFGIADEFVTKQLPGNVTWLLSLLYALDAPAQRHLSLQGEGLLAHDLRYLASVVSQSFLAFGDLLEMNRKFLELSGGVGRVAELGELLEACQVADEPSGSLSSRTGDEWRQSQSSRLREGGEEEQEEGRDGGEEEEDEGILFRQVDVVTPTRKLLARKLTFRVTERKSILVTGPNGCGKSSIFRVLGGLWPLSSGEITFPRKRQKRVGSQPMGMLTGGGGGSSAFENSVFYVPQKPYTALGTLRDQVTYPLSRERAAEKLESTIQRPPGSSSDSLQALDERLRSILEDVRLLYLLDREGGWDATTNWDEMLSLGEQQRLGMARLFFHQPKFGILDECTNATSVDVEEALYKTSKKLGISVVTISQRPALIPYHSEELRLIDGEGDWELRHIVT